MSAVTITKTVYRVRNPLASWSASFPTLKLAREVRRTDFRFKGPGSYIEKVITTTKKVR